jgi:hypothetical protein
MWTSESNSEVKFDDFATAFGGADTAGSWQQDYDSCCASHKIKACPFFKVSAVSPTTTSCKLMNTAIDLASWRAMLVAVTMRGSKVVEIVCHNVRIDRRHLTDLALMLKSCDALQSIKLDYLDFFNTSEEEGAAAFDASLSALLVEATNISFLSLKGNKLRDGFVTQFSDTLHLLPKLEGLSLSENSITDAGVLDILKVLPYCITLKKISLKGNSAITGSSLASSIKELLMGQPMGSHGEAAIKKLEKTVNDKNKQIQGVNKTRKKQSLEELPEVVLPVSRVVTIPDEESRVLNRSFEMLDFSNCAFNATDMTAFLAAAVESTSSGEDLPEGATALIIRVRKIDKDNAATLAKESFSGKLIVQK